MRIPASTIIGHGQADAVAERLARLGPLSIVLQPAAALPRDRRSAGRCWGIAVSHRAAVAEIPSPEGVAMADRVDWLREAMRARGPTSARATPTFRDGVVSASLRIDRDTVVFSHFVAINAAIGAAIGDDRLVIRSLDNCSVTVIDVVDGALHAGRRRPRGRHPDPLIRAT